MTIFANSCAAFVAINARNLLTFGLTYFVNDWLARDGVLNVFNVLGGTFGELLLPSFISLSATASRRSPHKSELRGACPSVGSRHKRLLTSVLPLLKPL